MNRAYLRARNPLNHFSCEIPAKRRTFSPSDSLASVSVERFECWMSLSLQACKCRLRLHWWHGVTVIRLDTRDDRVCICSNTLPLTRTQVTSFRRPCMTKVGRAVALVIVMPDSVLPVPTCRIVWEFLTQILWRPIWRLLTMSGRWHVPSRTPEMQTDLSLL